MVLTLGVEEKRRDGVRSNGMKKFFIHMRLAVPTSGDATAGEKGQAWEIVRSTEILGMP